MKKFFALALGLLVSCAAQAAMTVDFALDFGCHVVEKTGVFDDQTQTKSFEHDGCTYIAEAIEQTNKEAHEEVLIKVSMTRTNEAGAEVVIATHELVGAFGQEMMLNFELGTKHMVVKAIARKVATVDPVA